MKNFIPKSDEFFVGYLPQVPAKTMFFLRKLMVAVGVGIVAIGTLLVTGERQFSTATFEYGKYTTLEGFVFKAPIPHLKIVNGVDSLGNTQYKTLLLVGFGKAGANSALSVFENTLNNFDGKLVKVKGELIYGDNKTLFQISKNHLPEIKATEHRVTSSHEKIGVVSLIGEIVDPKCYFGVMKPGEGKPHRSCAIRCIAGGIPPVLKAEGSDYFILLDEQFKPVNEQVVSMVGDQITLTGEAVRFDNWKILLVKKESLQQQAEYAQVLKNLALMESGMTLCKTN